MSVVPTLLLAGVVLLTSACAGTVVKPAAALPAPVAAPVPEAPATAVIQAPAAVVADAPARPAARAESADPPPIVRDPWEGFNRKVHGFNNAADRFVLRPLAVGYDKVVPDPVQAGVSRFFGNLKTPATAVNQALQGRPGHAVQSLGRFAVNTTVGLGGVFDPATRLGMVRREDEDFGQTLASWGWRDSRYLVVPLFGPRTVRDTFAIVGDRTLSPLGQVQDTATATGLQVVQVVDVRARLLPVDRFRRDALDDYLFVRDAWAQRRNQQTRPDRHDE